MEYQPDPRPRTVEELRFEQRPAVRWFSPSVLARAGMKVVLSNAFGDYLDKRELQSVFADTLTLDHRAADEIWIDFVADTGDGFDPSYSVAWAVSQRELTVADATTGAVADDAPTVTLPRGRVLVLGGDEVYPVAKIEEYQNRFVGPYKAALPWTDGVHPEMLAIPGNHDWYDGLTGFMRVFGQTAWMGGRKSCQARSYFAVALPARWWLWGIDIQSDAYLDSAQIRYFRNIGQAMRAGDRLILCSAKPSWTRVAEPEAYRNLAYVERHIVPDDCEAVLMLSGDSHHYARYASADGRVKITSGGGGAFLSATHLLGHDLDIPQTREGTSRHTLQRTYPDAPTSRRLGWKALLLPFRNPSFMWVTGILHLLLFVANQFALRSLQPGGPEFERAARRWSWLDLAVGRLRNPSTIIVLLALFALLAGFAKPPRSVGARWAKTAVRVGMGLFHTVLQLAVAASVAWVALRFASFADGVAYIALAAAFIAIVGAVAGGIAFGLYLVLAMRLLGTHDNEVFSAIREEGFKGFVRLHIAPGGELTVYALGIRRPVREWEPDPDNPDREAPYLRPAGGRSVDVQLIDTVTIAPSPDLSA
jgi:hypothetical protein